MNKTQLGAFLARDFPQVGDRYVIEDLGAGWLEMRLRVSEGDLRPGGTVSGPSMFALADVAVYLAILAVKGPLALAVTTNASIDFMRKPAAGVDIIARAELVKLGASLAVAYVTIRSVGQSDCVAQSTMTYSLPRRS